MEHKYNDKYLQLINIIPNFRKLERNEIEELPRGLFSNLSKLQRL